jgi:hypothetical protein
MESLEMGPGLPRLRLENSPSSRRLPRCIFLSLVLRPSYYLSCEATAMASLLEANCPSTIILIWGRFLARLPGYLLLQLILKMFPYSRDCILIVLLVDQSMFPLEFSQVLLFLLTVFILLVSIC